MEKVLLNAMKDGIRKNSEKILKFYEHLHRHPELSFDEKRTKEFILSNIPKSEFIKIVDFQNTYGFYVDITLNDKAGGRTIAFRADMDALPVSEETGLSYSSENKGVMHACGHDAHCAIVFGAMCAAVENYEPLKNAGGLNVIRFIFQAAEEKAPGGAITLVKNGAMENVDMIFGMHVMPLLRSGQFGIREGGIMAAVDEFEVKLSGRGGHGSDPARSTDLILLAAEIIVSAQRIVSREIGPLAPAVVSFCTLKAGSAHNILPSTLEFSGTLRSVDARVRELLVKKIGDLIKSRCGEYGATYDINWIPGYPVTLNSPEAVKIFMNAAQKVIPDGVVYPVQQIMGSEDFSYYCEKTHAAFGFLGIAPPDGECNPIHSPEFKIENRDDILNGAMIFTAVICEFIN